MRTINMLVNLFLILTFPVSIILATILYFNSDTLMEEYGYIRWLKIAYLNKYE